MLREGGLSELGSTGLYLLSDYHRRKTGYYHRKIMFAHTSFTLLLPPIHRG